MNVRRTGAAPAGTFAESQFFGDVSRPGGRSYTLRSAEGRTFGVTAVINATATMTGGDDG